ncbi:Tpr family protein, partial [Theileria parva strain Muguga]
MFGNRRKWNSDFLMVYIDLVVAILLSLLSAVLWTLGYVSKHPTEDDALKSKATEVVKAIIQGLNGKVDRLATAVVTAVEQALKSAQAQQDPVNLDLTETIQAVLNAANGLSTKADAVKTQLEEHLEITNIQSGVPKSQVTEALETLTDPAKRQAAVAEVKGALGASHNDEAKIEDKDLTDPATEALKSVKLDGQAGAVKTNLKSGGSGKTQINIGDSITQALTKLEQNKPGTTGEKEPKPEAVQDVQSALSAGDSGAKTQFTSLWHIKGTDGYSSLD